ncbi:hypothetical protein GCM10011374_02960 [Kocuria dechangensis]|uniref:Uncharacterized protein n=1 Tax=Kocuria dechangensis TaxID=1176249 RepID=A0A917GFT8_9MICC|nr:hypothetical protein [Kocuria dechangensis]GGG44013.1 hypothetical protein GCM10011374_02960 [Kocuria dechangensis]
MMTTARTITRGVFAVLVIALLGSAFGYGELRFITAALLDAVAGFGVDARQTQAIAATR